MHEGASINDVQFFCNLWRYTTIYIQYIMCDVLSSVYLCTMSDFLEIPTYPKLDILYGRSLRICTCFKLVKPNYQIIGILYRNFFENFILFYLFSYNISWNILIISLSIEHKSRWLHLLPSCMKKPLLQIDWDDLCFFFCTRKIK